MNILSNKPSLGKLEKITILGAAALALGGTIYLISSKYYESRIINKARKITREPLSDLLDEISHNESLYERVMWVIRNQNFDYLMCQKHAPS